MNLTGKLNLAALNGTAFIKGKNGQPCFFIDIEKADLFKSDKGALYLDIISYENKDKKISDYMVKQSLSKEIREQEKAAGVQRPIIGNQSYMKPLEATAPEVEAGEFTDESDLPF